MGRQEQEARLLFFEARLLFFIFRVKVAKTDLIRQNMTVVFGQVFQAPKYSSTHLALFTIIFPF